LMNRNTPYGTFGTEGGMDSAPWGTRAAKG